MTRDLGVAVFVLMGFTAAIVGSIVPAVLLASGG